MPETCKFKCKQILDTGVYDVLGLHAGVASEI